MAPSKANYKIWRASNNSEAGFMVTPDQVVMAGSPDCFIASTSRGTAVSGPFSIMVTGDQVRRGGLWIESTEFLKMIPSTIVTPIPQVIPFPPISMFTHIALTLPFAMALLAG